MPMIRPSSDLRNKYADISEFCRQHSEPVFITKNGVGDLAVMSMETYERLANAKRVADQSWQVDAIQEGVRLADVGEFASEHEVTQAFARWGVCAK